MRNTEFPREERIKAQGGGVGIPVNMQSSMLLS